jgi:hypothetical protein
MHARHMQACWHRQHVDCTVQRNLHGSSNANQICMQFSVRRLCDFSQRDVCEQDHLWGHVQSTWAVSTNTAALPLAAAATAAAPVWCKVHGKPKATRGVPQWQAVSIVWQLGMHVPSMSSFVSTGNRCLRHAQASAVSTCCDVGSSNCVDRECQPVIFLRKPYLRALKSAEIYRTTPHMMILIANIRCVTRHAFLRPMALRWRRNAIVVILRLVANPAPAM